MKIRMLFTALLVVIFSLNVLSADDRVVVNSKLDEAKIFYSGAELTHSASYRMLKGENEIWIDGLSPNIDKNSIKIKTTNGVIVSSFEFSMDYLSSRTLNPNIQKLKDDIDKQQKLLNQVNTEIKINEKLLAILQKSTDKNIAGSDAGLSIDELIRTMDYYKTKSLEIEKTLSVDRERSGQILKDISYLKSQYEQESIKNTKISGILKLNLSSPADVNCNFIITYYTPSAGWVPYYDINVQSTDNPVKIITKAKVRQVTGTDWDKVKISLSTAMPSSGKIAPLFQTWFLRYITRYDNYSSRSKDMDLMMQNSYSYEISAELEEELSYDINSNQGVSSANGANMLYIVDGVPVSPDYYNSLDRNKIRNVNVIEGADAVNIYGSEASNGVVVITLKSSMDDFVRQTEDQMNIVFDIDMPYSIPGNGKEQSIQLMSQEVPAVFKYYSAPKMDTETYLLAEISDWQKLNLLSGNANVTYDGTYVGDTYINAESTQEVLSLTLGVDKRIVVKREKQKDFSSTKFLGSDVKQEFSYLLTVRNNQNKEIKMVLKDQYPVSTTKEITVELAKDIVNPTYNIESMGVVTWEFDMKPGETKTFKMVYSVKYPKGKELNL